MGANGRYWILFMYLSKHQYSNILLSSEGANSSPGQNGDMQSPKRVCNEYRNVLVERNSFPSPLKDRLLPFSSPRSKLPPPLQSAFSR